MKDALPGVGAHPHRDSDGNVPGREGQKSSVTPASHNRRPDETLLVRDSEDQVINACHSGAVKREMTGDGPECLSWGGGDLRIRLEVISTILTCEGNPSHHVVQLYQRTS